MRNLIKCLIFMSIMGAIPAHAAPCETPDSALRAAIHEVLSTASDPQIAGWAGYLNERFYSDLACRLAPDMTADDVLGYRDDPAPLLAHARLSEMTRNQSDALMLILSAMQSTLGESAAGE